MLKNYFKIAFRNLWRNKVYSFLNITGLAIGTAVCLLILLFVSYELSFDHSHKKADRIYRLHEITSFEGLPTQLQALTMYPMAPTITEEYPEVENFVRFTRNHNLLVKQGSAFTYIPKGYFVDSTVFEVFDFPLIQGDPKKALQAPNTVVITASTAQRLFGKRNPIGQTLRCRENGEWLVKVTGVMEDLPGNSHLQFDALFSFSSLTPYLEENQTSWRITNNWVFTYLLLSEQASVAKLRDDFPRLLDKHAQEGFNEEFQIDLQPLTKMHLDSQDMTLDWMNEYKFDRGYLHVFIVLALLVLLLASINFINLSTARSVTRAKEVGIRKTMGAYRWQLILQLTSEAIFYAFLAIILASLLVSLVLPFVSELTQRTLVFNPLSNLPLGLFLIGMTFFIGISAGIYPALYISGYQPVKALKGKMYTTRSRFSLRNVLVVGQFAIAVGLIITTLLVVQQLNYLHNKDIGFNKEQVLLVSLEGVDDANYEPLKAELTKNAAILGVTAADQRLGERVRQLSCEYRSDTAQQELASYIINVDYNYFDFYGIQMNQGRSFSEAFADDEQQNFILNEAAVKALGGNSAKVVGGQFGFSWRGDLGNIVGVSENFNHNSLHHVVEPLALMVNREWGFSEMAIRLEKQNINSSLQYVEEQWNKFFPGIPIRYTFMDEHFEAVYQDEKRISQIVSIFTVLAIIVASLGLFGLAAFTTQQRTKEIGVRKVLGASITSILILILRDFVKLVLVAIIIACPLAYWFMQEWLASFAFRITIGLEVFVAAGLGAVLVATFTVLYHAGQSARTNPVEVLRNE